MPNTKTVTSTDGVQYSVNAKVDYSKWTRQQLLTEVLKYYKLTKKQISNNTDEHLRFRLEAL